MSGALVLLECQHIMCSPKCADQAERKEGRGEHRRRHPAVVSGAASAGGAFAFLPPDLWGWRRCLNVSWSAGFGWIFWIFRFESTRSIDLTTSVDRVENDMCPSLPFRHCRLAATSFMPSSFTRSDLAISMAPRHLSPFLPVPHEMALGQAEAQRPHNSTKTRAKRHPSCLPNRITPSPHRHHSRPDDRP